MFKMYIIVFLMFYAGTNAFAQKEYYNWYFGWETGITFVTDNKNPKPIVNSAIRGRNNGCAALSDSIGKLLFYTNGFKVWNRHNEIMENGDSLTFQDNSNNYQNVIALDYPGNDSLKLLLHIGFIGYDHVNKEIFNMGDSSFGYSVINVSMNDGLGKVIKKYQPISDDIYEGMTILKHRNNRDYWLVVHQLGSYNYLSYKIDSNGIDSYNPVVSTQGMMWDTSNKDLLLLYKWNLRSSSTSGQLAHCNWCTNTIEIFDFNNKTGELVFNRFIAATTFDCEFSPDGSKIYYHNLKNWGQKTDIIQYDLKNSKKTIIGQAENPLISYKLGPDGKIYISAFAYEKLMAVEKPNEPGLNCCFNSSKLNLTNGYCGLTLPKFPNTHFLVDVNIDTIIEVCEGYPIDIDPNYSLPLPEEDTLKWLGPNGFSSTAQKLHFEKADKSIEGWYYITVSSPINTVTDSVQVIVHPPPTAAILPEGDVTLCEGSTATLTAADCPGCTYRWSTGETGNEISVKDEQEVWLYVENEFGCVDSAGVNVHVEPNIMVSINGIKTMCEGDTLLLKGPWMDEGYQYTWSTGENTKDIEITKGGTYWLNVENDYGCSGSDTIKITEYPAPEPVITGDTAICEGQITELSADRDYGAYRWSTGEETKTIQVSDTGYYELVVYNQNGCSGKTGVNIIKSPNPVVNIIGDTEFCQGNTVMLSADEDFASYEWSTGEATKEIEADTEGWYYLAVTDEKGCTALDSIEINEMVVEIEINPGKYDFGYVYADNQAYKLLTVTNTGKEEVRVDLELEPKTNIFTLSENQVELVPGEDKTIDLTFTPTDIIDYETTIKLKILQPCKKEYEVKLNGAGKGDLLVSLPEMQCKIDRHECIPVTAQIQSGRALKNTSDYDSEISIYGLSIQPEIPYSITNDIMLVELSGNNVFVDTSKRVIGSICGQTLLPISDINRMEFSSFTWGDPHLIPVTENGAIEITGYCKQNIRKIMAFESLSLSISPNPATDYIDIENTYDEKISIYDVLGRQYPVRKLSENNSGVRLDVSGLSPGTYFITVQGGAGVRAVPVVVR